MAWFRGDAPRDQLIEAKLVGALNVLGCDDFVDARHFFRFFGIDLDDLRVVGEFRLHHDDVQGVFRHLQFDVVAVVGCSANLCKGCRTHQRKSVVFFVFRKLDHDVFHSAFPTHDLGCCHDGVDDLLVAGAAADVPVFLEPVADIFPGRILILLQKAIGRYDESGRAEAALHRTEMHERHLQRVQEVRGSDAFNSGYSAVFVYSGDFLGAGTDDLAVQDHRARPAKTLAASDFGAGKAQASQYRCQCVRFGITNKHPVGAIDVESEFSEFHKLFFLHTSHFIKLSIGLFICVRI